MALHLRALTEEEGEKIKKWSQSRSEEARLVERAKIIRLGSRGMAGATDSPRARHQ